MPHVPQFDGDTAVLVSQPFDALPSQLAKPALQAPSPQVPPVPHTDAALAKVHEVPHAPQLETVFRAVSQPSAAMPLQSPKPAAHVLH